jgi:multicomponent Na+:H+ antiporter subunit E
MILFIDSLILWLLLTWTLDYESLAVGICISLIITLIFHKSFSQRPLKWLQPHRYLLLIICYVPLFTWECIKANLDVAYRVLNPMMPIEPGIVKVKTRLISGIGRTVLANSITMTPGTLTIDMEGNDLYIHWIKVRSQDTEIATKKIVSKFEGLLIKIFE